MRADIPYRVYGGLRFFERAEIKDALAYLRLVSSRQDDPSFERIVNTPTRGIGNRTLEQVREHARVNQISMWEAAGVLVHGQELSSRAISALGSFLNLIERLAILFPHGVVDSKDLPEKYQSEGNLEISEASAAVATVSMSESNLSQLPGEGIDMKKYLTDIEISLIEQALSNSNNVVARAATMLNMRRTTLVEKMRKYEIERTE